MTFLASVSIVLAWLWPVGVTFDLMIPRLPLPLRRGHRRARRPLVASFLFRGGSTAVAMGLSFLTCAQYLGQTPMSFIMEGLLSQGFTYASATMTVLVPVGVVGIVLAFLVRPSKKAEQHDWRRRVVKRWGQGPRFTKRGRSDYSDRPLF